jgi:Ran GTPase-activating protein (RanGAP) involved in mRNA processing and transport
MSKPDQKTEVSLSMDSDDSVTFFSRGWSKDQGAVLSALQTAYQMSDDSGLAAQFETLCQRYRHQTRLNPWEGFFREVHKQFNGGWLDAKHLTPPDPGALVRQAFPPVAPFWLHIERCADTRQLAERIQAAATLPAMTTASRVNTYYLFYSTDQGSTTVRFGRWGESPSVGMAHTLYHSLEETPVPDDQVLLNLQRLAMLSADFIHHPALTLDVLRQGLSAYASRTPFWAPPAQSIAEDKDKPQRVIGQQRSKGWVYYGQWFVLPDNKREGQSLPGRWTVVYPESEADQILETPVGDGWVLLDETAHGALISGLEKFIEHRRRTRLAEWTARCHQDFEQSIRENLTAPILRLWYRLSAEAAAQQRCWFSLSGDTRLRPYALLQIAKAMEGKEELPKQWAEVANGWVQETLREILRRLMPLYLKQLDQSLQPFRQAIGALSLAHFTAAQRELDQLVRCYGWVDAVAVQAAYVQFNAVCQDRRSDIVVQMQTMAKGGPGLQKELSAWYAAVAELLNRWQRDGFHDLATSDWGIPVESPETAILRQMKSGLAQLPAAPERIPEAWRQAHQDFLQRMKRFGELGQHAAFERLKNRYRIRLRCYQRFCATQKSFSIPAQWCEQRLKECEALTLSQSSPVESILLDWPWRETRRLLQEHEDGERKIPREEKYSRPLPALRPLLYEHFGQLLTHLSQRLGEPPSPFAVLGWIENSTTSSPTGEFNFLIAEESLSQHPYWTALWQALQLYLTLLPAAEIAPFTPEIAKIAEAPVTIPQKLAQRYCPLWIPSENISEEKTEQKQTHLTNWPVFQFHSPIHSLPLWVDCLHHLCRQLKSVADETKKAEENIRKKHGALLSQTLRDESQLEKRLQARREISELRRYLQNRYAAALELLAFSALTSETGMDHWQQYIYRRIPRLWKSNWLAQLKHWDAHFPGYQRLCEESDSIGWSYREEELRRQRLVQVREWIVGEPSSTPLLDEKTSTGDHPPATLRFVEEGQVFYARLKPAIVKQLWDDPYFKAIKAGQDSTLSSPHTLRMELKSETENQFNWVLNPPQPSIAYWMQRVAHRLGIHTVGPCEMYRLQIGQQPPIPVSVSPAGYDTALEEVKSAPQRLEQLSPYAFVSLFLETVIFNLEDRLQDSLCCAADPDFSGHYRLIRRGGGQAFLDSHGKIQARKSLVYCLDLMGTSWTELERRDPRLSILMNRFKRLNPMDCITDIIEEISDVHDEWCALFSCAEIIGLAQSGVTHREYALPLMTLPPGYERSVLEKIYFIQQAMNQGEVSGWSLLNGIAPESADDFQRLFQSKTTPLARFEHGWRRTEPQSSPSLWRELKVDATPGGVIQLIQSVWHRRRYSPAQAWHSARLLEKIMEIERGFLLLAGDPVYESKSSSRLLNQEEVKSRYEQAHQQFCRLPISGRVVLVNRISRLLPTFDDKRHRAVAKRVLHSLSRAPMEQLILSAYGGVLTPVGLIAILSRAGRRLLALDISDCRLLTAENSRSILQALTDHCPNLRILKAQNLSWKKVILESLPYCRLVDFSRCSALKQVLLLQLERLESLHLQECGRLQTLANSGLWSVSAFVLPRLRSVTLDHCTRLTTVSIQVGEPDQLTVSAQHCPRIQSTVWGLEEKTYTPSSRLLEKITAESGDRWNLSDSQLTPIALQWLSRLLCFNPGLTALDLRENAVGGAEGATILARILRTQPTLKRLDLSHPKEITLSLKSISSSTETYPWGNDEIKQLLPALEAHPALVDLNWAENVIGDAGAALLAQWLSRRPSLQRLDLRGNLIGDAGGQALLQALAENYDLVFLDVSENPISAEYLEGIDRLVQRNQQLQYYFLASTALMEPHPAIVDEHREEKHLSTAQTLSIQPILIKAPITPDSLEADEKKSVAAPQAGEWMEFLQPLVAAEADDIQPFSQRLERLAELPLDHPLTSCRDHLRTLADEKNQETLLEELKCLCWALQAQQRSVQLEQSVDFTSGPVAESSEQAYIQSRSALKEYHDELLRTLEFGLKAAALGVTGRLRMTNTAGTILSVVGGGLSAIPEIGDIFKVVFSGLEACNQLRMKYRDHQLTQWFVGGRDLEEKVAVLARRMTLSIRDELLEKKPTPARQAVYARWNWREYPRRIGDQLTQQKLQLFHWQKLSDSRKLAVHDACYLLDQLAKQTPPKETQDYSGHLLKLLMRDPEFKYTHSFSEESPIDRHQSTPGRGLEPLDLPLISVYSTQWCEIWSQLQAQSREDLTPRNWPQLLLAVEELETVELKLSEQAKAGEDTGYNSWLESWFERLRTAPGQPVPEPSMLITETEQHLFATASSSGSSQSSLRGKASGEEDVESRIKIGG